MRRVLVSRPLAVAVGKAGRIGPRGERPMRAARALVVVAAASALLLLVAFAAAPARALADATPMLLATPQATFTGSQTTTEYDQLGCAVAVSGDTAIVGAPYYQAAGAYHRGRAYVFVRSGGVWTQQAILTASDESDASYFGYSVAIDGDTVVVGAYGHLYTAGSVYVFTRSGTTWTEAARLDGPQYGVQGWSVAISGGTILTGSWRGLQQPGAAVVYTGAGSMWTAQQTLTPDDLVDGDGYGFAVALHGETAVVGAPFRYGGTNTGAGVAYVFTRDGTTWTQVVELQGNSGDLLGRAVAVSGSTALIGAPGNASNTGEAVVLADTGGGWAREADLRAGDATSGDFFGHAVALSGNTALVGAEDRPWSGLIWAGATYGFERDAGTWTQRAEFFESTPAQMHQFGFSLAIDGTTALVGAPSAQSNAIGAAYAYLLNDSPDTTPPVTTVDVEPTSWTNEPVSVRLSVADDMSGVVLTQYQVQGAATWQTYVGPFAVTTQGVTTWKCGSTDAAGNVESPPVSFKTYYDKLGPTTKALANMTVRRGKKAAFRFKVSDLTPQAKVSIALYQKKKLKRTIKAGTWRTGSIHTFAWTCTLAKGAYVWKVLAVDQAGNKQRSVVSRTLTVK